MGGACGTGRTAPSLDSLTPAVPGAPARAPTAKWKKDFASAYDLGDLLGSGSFGEVYEAVRKKRGNPSEVAVKTVRKESNNSYDEAREQLLAEYAILSGLRHQNVIGALEMFKDEPNGDMFFVIDICRGGTLLDVLVHQEPAFSEQASAVICQQVLSGIAFMCQHQILHRDLKVENLLLRREGDIRSIVISDFGLACKLDNGAAPNALCGSEGPYLAPEMLQLAAGAQTDSKLGFGVDIWAMGVVAHIVLCGREPDFRPQHGSDSDFSDEEEDESSGAGAGLFDFRDMKREHNEMRLSPQATDFIMQMVQLVPKDRPSAATLLSHPFLDVVVVPQTMRPGSGQWQ